MTNILHLGRFSFAVPSKLQANSCAICFGGCCCWPFYQLLGINEKVVYPIETSSCEVMGFARPMLQIDPEQIH